MWQALIGPVTDLIGGVLKRRSEVKQAEHEARLRIIEHESDWETKMAAASATSWKDEFWTLILSLPIFFIGYAVFTGDSSVIDRLKEGIATLDQLPEWYQYLLFIAVTASFGIRGADKIMQMRKKSEDRD
jgi:hypothetical protein